MEGTVAGGSFILAVAAATVAVDNGDADANGFERTTIVRQHSIRAGCRFCLNNIIVIIIVFVPLDVDDSKDDRTRQDDADRLRDDISMMNDEGEASLCVVRNSEGGMLVGTQREADDRRLLPCCMGRGRHARRPAEDV